jgi:thiol-disulfide isomerase/thioredoxin
MEVPMRTLVAAALIALALPARAFTPDPAGPLAERLVAFAAPVAVPGAAFTAPDGTETTLADWSGRAAIVTIWATWCEVCHEELPVLDRLAAEGGPVDVVTVSVDQVDPARTITRYFEREGLANLPAYSDRAHALATQIGVRVTPTSLVIDRFGQVVAAIEGKAPWEHPEMRAFLAALATAPDADASRALLAPLVR